MFNVNKFVIPIFILSGIYLLAISHSIFTEYFFTDDVRYFDHGTGWGITDAAKHYLSSGRPVFSGIISIYGSIIDSVSDLSYLRLFIGLLSVVSMILIFFTIRLILPQSFAFFISAFYLLLPSTFFAHTWTIVTAHLYAVIFCTIAYFCVLQIDKHGKNKRKFYVFSVIFILLSAFTYQAAALFFLFFTFIRIIFDTQIKNTKELLKFLLRDFALCGGGLLFYFISHKYGFLPFYLSFPELGVAPPQLHHKFTLAIDALGRSNLFFDRLLPLSFGSFMAIPTFSKFTLGILVSIFFVSMFRENSRLQKSLFFSGLQIFAIFLIFIISHIANLMPQLTEDYIKNHIGFRTMIGPTFMVIFMAYACLRKLLFLNGGILKPAVWQAFSLILILSWLGHNLYLVTFSITNLNREYVWMSDFIKADLRSKNPMKQLHVTTLRLNEHKRVGDGPKSGTLPSTWSQMPRGMSNAIVSTIEGKKSIAPFLVTYSYKSVPSRCQKEYETLGIKFLDFRVLRGLPVEISLDTTECHKFLFGSEAILLLVNGYKKTNYNIILNKGTFYALHQADGGLDLKKLAKGLYTYPVFKKNTYREILESLD
jgi:hypothetical protein